MDLSRLTIAQAHQLLSTKEVSSKEIVQSVFTRIESVEKKVKSYTTLTYERAMEQARLADDRISKGTLVPLTGIPLAIKDIMCMRGMRTTCGSRILGNFISPYDATVIKNLKAANTIFIGRTNMDEFAMGSSTETSYFGVTRNPWDPERVPGGSSGGSAAAVSADECLGALGTDTGGSIRQPAAFCGIVGLKPTYGRVSRFGLVAFASSLDQIGPMTKEVRDAAVIMNTIAGHDPHDSTSVPIEVADYTQVLGREVQGMSVGIPKEYFIEGLDPEVSAAVEEALKVLQGLGMEIKEIALPHTHYAVAVYYLIAPAEASSNLARYDGVKYGHRADESTDLLDMYTRSRSEGFGMEVKRRIMLGTYALSAGYYDAYFKKASQVRTLIRKDFEKAFQECDVMVTPTAPTPAFKIAEKIHDPLEMYLSDIFTIPANLAGIPGISIPCGFTRLGLPIGLQILAPSFQEEKLFKVAYAYEQHTSWHLKKPEL